MLGVAFDAATIAFSAMTLALGSSAIGAGDSAPQPVLDMTTDAVSGDSPKIPVGASVGVYGLTDEGERFDYTYIQSEDSPASGPSLAEPTVAGAQVVDAELVGTAASTNAEPETVPFQAVQAASAVCSVFISDVSFFIGQGFDWETSQTCSGAFGEQRHRTQMWRSSWSGPRGYGNWSQWTPWTVGSFVSRHWNIACGGGGTYDYYPVVVGTSSVIGSSPAVRSDNHEREPCGTSPS